MHRSVVGLSLLVAATLLAGCSSSDGDDESGAGPPANGDPTSDDPTSDDFAEGDAGDDEPAATREPLITFDTQEALLEEVFGIFAGVGWDRTPLSLPEFGPLFEFRELRESSETESGWPTSFGPARCSSGEGELALEVPVSATNYGWRARLDACVPDDAGATGLALVSGSVTGDWNWHTAARSADLAWTRVSGERVSFSGEIRSIPNESGGAMVRSFITADAYQSVLGDGATPLLVIEQATSTLRSGTTGPINLAMLSGGFTYRSVLSGGRTVTVHTPLELAYSWNTGTPAPDGIAPETLGELPLGDPFSGGTPRSEEQNAAVDRVRLRWAFVTGMLVVEAEDGSRVTLDADTGELDTVRITIDAGRGEGSEGRVIEWPGSWFRVLAPHTLPSVRAEEAQ